MQAMYGAKKEAPLAATAHGLHHVTLCFSLPTKCRRKGVRAAERSAPYSTQAALPLAHQPEPGHALQASAEKGGGRKKSLCRAVCLFIPFSPFIPGHKKIQKVTMNVTQHKSQTGILLQTGRSPFTNMSAAFRQFRPRWHASPMSSGSATLPRVRRAMHLLPVRHPRCCRLLPTLIRAST